MLDVLERIEARERREIEKSKREGRKEARIEVAKNMIKEGYDIDFIYTITGLKKTKIEELLNNCK